MSGSEEYHKIRKRVRLKKGVFIHLGVYVIVILFLFVINWLTNDHPHDDWWFLFPAVSWGMAVAIHALTVLGFSGTGLFGEEWEKQQIREALEKKG